MLPKNLGGIGIRDAELANTALLGKLVSDCLQGYDKLWIQVLFAKYLGKNSILDVEAKLNSSYFWRGLLKARDDLRHGFSFKLGQGQSSFWYSDWSGLGMLAFRVPFVHISDTNLKLADLVVNGQWDTSWLYTSLPDFVGQRLQEVTPSLHPQGEDRWVWNNCAQGFYTASEGYAWLC